MPVIGSHVLRNNLFVAPMAGVTDRPFRQLCKRLGAGYAVSEMVASNAQLWKSAKTMRRANHEGEVEPIAVQIAGADPAMMAEAARYNVDNGAQIIDINMGCPAKKVCNVAAGSALLQNEPLVQRIVEAVVAAVGTGPDAVPVTLKIRTGWDREHKNAITVARLAEAAGISMLTVHGRTRADLYRGDAEYETIAAVKAAVRIPVVANGDITSPAKAKAVLDATGADALMIGRAAQGRPWLFREIDHFLQTGELLPPPLIDEIQQVMNEHLEDHYAFYGEFTGVRTARKHIGWYTRGLSGANGFRHRMNTLDSSREQLAAVNAFFEAQKALSDHLVYVDDEEENGQGESDDHNQLAA
ncbi:tRNA dihydrouridine synthase DusB [Burkholderia stabilis]|uniref:tRNA-dihydrouridine synthase B n=1 Tax=Burkholderia stabilis TaxID=95485 RepID=A0AAJ5T3L7_9BURK|nr:tRNA dihydrouridine synthase DusB [Burkholderia stabilis]AOR67634.1 tRNA dihydrouridine synthase DusB [Burkholderia stabilis]VBB11698.1 Probable tRNA-dihydrouridine synthase,tRNA-dihydrouridine synthase B,Predicted permeases,putative TIM-barrel protein, nifR3 family,Dihydrouridine synthase (Dus) [Burkholderia stabilis]HDR9494940.1 tRNA dihydrouridine synthase DusB [Burkholderia stabilis]HDR9525503.1 tRNA dihydrouridine synthase DusB [Burkholderia stabilis]HDR9533422.1 tRNA dihydrouridine sy